MKSKVIAWTAKHALAIRPRTPVMSRGAMPEALAHLAMLKRPATARDISAVIGYTPETIRDVLTKAAKEGHCKLIRRRTDGRDLPTVFEAV